MRKRLTVFTRTSILIVASAFAFGCTRKNVPAPAADLLTPISAEQMKASFSKPKATVMNLWATWCAPCKEEMPEFVKLQKEYSSRGVEVALVSADNPEDEKKAADFLKSIGVEFKTFKLSEEPTKFINTFDPSWQATLPTTYLFDSTGKIVKTWIGRVKIAEVETEITKLLSTK